MYLIMLCLLDVSGNCVINIRSKMLEEKVLTLFRESTKMYCEGSYSACVALLTDCLNLQPCRSVLYSNRAIGHHHLRDREASLADLQRAVSLNHLNYIAYFNLFSLHFLSARPRPAFSNLCLCLASAHTLLARAQRTPASLQRAI